MIRIPIAKPYITDDEIEAVVRVLKSGRLTRGEETKLFEKEFADYIGARYAVAVMNGTVALEASLKAVGIKQGDEVIVPDLTFIATANSVLNTGAKPVFADVDEKTVTISPDSIMEKISKKTKAIIPVHLYGHPADMKAIKEIADDHRLTIIEDAAQSHGASYNGRKTGSLGDIAAFSFYATKNMMTGEGGMIVTNDEMLYKRLLKIRCHGEIERYVSDYPGTNLHMTEMQAAIGRVQLRKLDMMNKKRRAIASMYNEAFSRINEIETPVEREGCIHVYHQYVIKVPESDRDELSRFLISRGIATAIHYPLPLHLQPLYKHLGYEPKQNPTAIELSKKLLSIPVHPLLTGKEVEFIITTITSFFNGEEMPP